MIEVKDLCFSYRSREVLKGVSFQAREGTVSFVLGANGAGKTTLFRCLLGLYRPSAGAVLLDGEDLTRLPPPQLAKRLAYIPQSHAPVFDFTVLDMVLMGTNHDLGTFRSPGAEERRRAMSALERVGAQELTHRVFRRLSGGEQQLVLIARALAQGSRVLVMDEPTANLDYGNQLLVLECVCRLAEEGYTVLISSHDPQHALWYAHRVLALDGGVVVADGPAGEVLDGPLLQQLYGVEAEFAQASCGRVIVPRQIKTHKVYKEEME